jgi:hypothetical protein
VTIHGQSSSDDAIKWLTLAIAPNYAQCLSEFIRAQNHPHLQVQVSFAVDPNNPKNNPTINWMMVMSDYDLPPTPFTPPFDVRVINQASS